MTVIAIIISALVGWGMLWAGSVIIGAFTVRGRQSERTKDGEKS